MRHTEKVIRPKDIYYMPVSETDPGYRDIISVLEFTESVFEGWICLRLFGDSWRRKWQPTPVFLPGEFQGQGSLVGCRLCGPTESDTTEAT